VLSAFVNNVGALAMLMPLAITTARKHDLSPSSVLMPLSFATMLGGMTTLIGTPPNIIVSTYRAESAGVPFHLFDFAPVGVVVAVCGLLFLSLLGWRLIPRDRRAGESFAGVSEYVAELHVSSDPELATHAVSEVAEELESREVQLLGVLREGEWTPGITHWTKLQTGDVLLVEGAPNALAELQGWRGASLAPQEHAAELLKPADTVLAEVVLRPQSPPTGSTPEELRIRTRYHVNVLGVSRQGARHFGALKSFRLAPGDVLLLQGKSADVADAISAFDALPLGDRKLTIHARREAYMATGAFIAALGAIAAGIAPPAVTLIAAVVVLLLLRVVRLSRAYAALDGSVIVVLGALIPVGQSLQTTGVTELIGNGLLTLTSGSSMYVSLALILLITMFLSDVINNAATALVMAPVAATTAAGLGASSDPFLMAVAIGASCAFLTPIGHQNNLLVMGPGGYRFGDYWRVGLPLELLIVIVAVAVLPLVWPFTS
jgi:di/tricarboxylate transporter